MSSASKILAKFLLVLGVILLSAVIFPLVYSTLQFRLLSSPRLIDPTQVSYSKAPQVLNVLGLSTTDYSQASSWFEAPALDSSSPSGDTRYYLLNFSRLGLKDVPVEIDGSNLKKNAIHYPGTALPGAKGNTVIFGHSALPYFYKPLNPLTIFNPLVDTKIGDEITIKYDGVVYKYLVTASFEVTPKQVDVLSQNTQARELTLITCVPLGTYWHRLIVKAQLVN